MQAPFVPEIGKGQQGHERRLIARLFSRNSRPTFAALRGCGPLVCYAVVAALAGCGQSTAKAERDSTAAGPGAAGPDKVVAEFLQALRTGNDAKASSLLTSAAREKTAEAKLEVGLPASPSASFEVGEVETVAEDGAHVASTWTDVREDAEPRTDRIVWILRKETEGWRVAGMAIKIFDDQEPLILNFEDPADMLRKQQLAEKELTRRAAEEESQATRGKKDFN